jgi:hypothetical protein
MHHRQRAGGGDLDGEIPVGDCVHAVGCDAPEAELVSHAIAIERQRRAGQRAAPER